MREEVWAPGAEWTMRWCRWIDFEFQHRLVNDNGKQGLIQVAACRWMTDKE